MSFNIRNGQTIDVAVQPGQSIAISTIAGTVTATVIAGASAGTVLLSASTSGGIYGPYATGAVVRLTAGSDSTVDYDTGIPPLNNFDSNVKGVFAQDGTPAGLNVGGAVIPLPGTQIFYQSAAPVYAPTLATQQCIFALNIPANTMGKNGNIQIRAEFSETNNANTKTIAFRLGGKYFYSAGLANFASAVVLMEVANRGATNSQVATPINVSNAMGFLGQPLVKFEIDTTIDQVLMIEVTKATAADVVALESMIIWSNYRA